MEIEARGPIVVAAEALCKRSRITMEGVRRTAVSCIAARRGYISRMIKSAKAIVKELSGNKSKRATDEAYMSRLSIKPTSALLVLHEVAPAECCSLAPCDHWLHQMPRAARTPPCG